MKQTSTDIMGMPITIHIADAYASESDVDAVFAYLRSVDNRFSTYKHDSEISRINRGEISEESYSDAIKEIFREAARTKEETGGYFDIQRPDRTIDPSGIVKGWAITKSAQMLEERGFKHFFVDAGGDVEVRGENPQGRPWQIGIRNPFDREEVVKIVSLQAGGIATSGTSIRGAHIYNPRDPSDTLTDIASITVIGSTAYDADRFATAAFAMGREGIIYIESLPGFDAYAISSDRRGICTSGFERFVS